MKYTIILFLAFLSMGCQNSDKRLIDEAETLVDEHPDSALVLLGEVNNIEKLGAKYSARYSITDSKARMLLNKAIIDTLTISAWQYYKNAEPQDSLRKLRATTAVALYHWWTGHKDKAYKTLNDAITEYDNSHDINSTNELLNELLQLYGYDNNGFAEALAVAQRLYRQDGNSEYGYMYYENMALMQYYLGNYEKTDSLYDNILSQAKSHNDTIIYWRQSLRNYADVASDYDNPQKSINMLNRIIERYKGKERTQESLAYMSMARCFLIVGDLDKAELYLQQAKELATDDMKSDLTYTVYEQILNFIIDYSKHKKISLKNLALLVNNLQQEQINRQEMDMARKEQNELLEKRMFRLTIARQKEQIMVICIIFMLIIAIGALLVYNRRKKHILEEKAEELDALQKLYAESKQAEERHDDRFFKKVLLQQLGVIRMAASNPTNANQDLLKRMTEITNKEVAVETLLDWNNLYKTIDYIYNGYYTNIRNLYGSVLNEKELQLCCLLKANFSTKEISVVTQQSVRTIYQRKTVIRTKLGMEEKADIAEFFDRH